MQHTIYYTDDTVQVSSSQVLLGQRTYNLSDVALARVQWKLEGRIASCGRQIVVLGMVAYAVCVVGLATIFLLANHQPEPMWLPLVFIFGQPVAVALVASILIQSVTVVELDGIFGRISILTSRDPFYSKKVAKAINRAIAEYKTKAT